MTVYHSRLPAVKCVTMLGLTQTRRSQDPEALGKRHNIVSVLRFIIRLDGYIHDHMKV